MKKIVCLFPGQGSQYVGMGSQFTNDRDSSEIFTQAEEALGFSLKTCEVGGGCGAGWPMYPGGTAANSEIGFRAPDSMPQF